MTRIAPARAPAPAAANPRASIGGNRPPADELAVIDFNEAIDSHRGLRERIAALIESSTRAEAIDDDSAARCAELVRQIGAVEKVVEDERKGVKEPYLRAGRAIDDSARTLVAKLVEAKASVRRLAEAYLREKQRQADIERRRIEDEARKAREEAAARAEAEARRAAEEGREPEQVELEPMPAAPPPAEPVRLRSDFGAVASARKVKVAEITDYARAFRAVKSVPAVQEAIQKAVNALVRAGQTNIPGVIIRDDVGLSVR